MIKVEVLEDFTLGRFDELKNIQRKSKEEKGRLFTGDIFECKKDLADYLIKTNSLGRAFVRIIEIVPETKERTQKIVKEAKEKDLIKPLEETFKTEPKIKRKTTNKTIAKK